MISRFFFTRSIWNSAREATYQHMKRCASFHGNTGDLEVSRAREIDSKVPIFMASTSLIARRPALTVCSTDVRNQLLGTFRTNALASSQSNHQFHHPKPECSEWSRLDDTPLHSNKICSSVLKKRRKKMNKHKYRKWRKKMRFVRRAQKK